VQVRAAVRSVETNLESVVISTKATELSVKKYELEKARFDAGLSTARLVLQAQDDLEASRLSELQAKVTLRNAIAELHRLEGSSLTKYNIAL
jgi:outer membrane protein